MCHSAPMPPQYHPCHAGCGCHEAPLMPPTMNFAAVKPINGRPHFVVPVVLLVEGVHNGSNGPVLYTANALRESAPAWNGVPVTLRHPTGSVRDPASGAVVLGVVRDAAFDGRRLKAEAWIDKDKVRSAHWELATALDAGQMMEVSTGLNFDADRLPDGTLLATNYKPDHLAILPDQVGACSISDGCGLVRNVDECNDTDVLLVPTMF